MLATYTGRMRNNNLEFRIAAPLVVRNYIHVQGSLLYCYSNEPF